MDYQRILVTGGAGFVGSHVALRLKAERGTADVIALDNLKRRGSELNLPRLDAGGVRFVHGDVRSPADVLAAGEFDLMIECSAEPSVLAGIDGSPDYLLQSNLVGLLNCLEAARRRRADLVFLSTSRVYPIQPLAELRLIERETRFELAPRQGVPGASPAGISEAFPLEGARSLYGATKLAGELFIHEYIAAYGLRALINRCGVLTGPWQMGKVDQGVIVLWVVRHVLGGKLAYLGFGGQGKQVRDVLHVDDLCDLMLLQLADMGRHTGQVYNVGGGPELSVSLRELTAVCERVTGRRIEIGSVAENRAADIPWYVTDAGKVKSATGWAPRRGLEQIVAEVAAWIGGNREALAAVLGR